MDETFTGFHGWALHRMDKCVPAVEEKKGFFKKVFGKDDDGKGFFKRIFSRKNKDDTTEEEAADENALSQLTSK